MPYFTQSLPLYKQRSTATSGTVTIDNVPNNILLIHEAGATATLTIALLANPIDGQMVTVTSVGGVTALTLSAAIGAIINTITTIVAGAPATYIYDLANNKWYKG